MSAAIEAVLLATQRRLALVEDELREQRRQAAEHAELAGRALRVKDEEIALLINRCAQLSMSKDGSYGGVAAGTSKDADADTGVAVNIHADDGNDDGDNGVGTEGAEGNAAEPQRDDEGKAGKVGQRNDAEGVEGRGDDREHECELNAPATDAAAVAVAAASGAGAGAGTGTGAGVSARAQEGEGEEQNVHDSGAVAQICANKAASGPSDAAVSAVMGQLTRVYQLLEEERRVRAAAEQQVEELQEEMCEMRALCTLHASGALRSRHDDARAPRGDARVPVTKNSAQSSSMASAPPTLPPQAPWDQAQGFHPPPPFDMNSPVVMELLRTAAGGNRHQAQAARRWLRHVESGAELTDAFPLEMTFCMLTTAVCDGFVKLVAPMLKRRPDVTITVFTRHSREDGEKWDVRLVVAPVQYDLDLNLSPLDLSGAVPPEGSSPTGKLCAASSPQASRGGQPWGSQSPVIGNATAGSSAADAIEIAQLSGPASLSPSLSSGSDLDLEGDCDARGGSMWVGE